MPGERCSTIWIQQVAGIVDVRHNPRTMPAHLHCHNARPAAMVFGRMSCGFDRQAWNLGNETDAGKRSDRAGLRMKER